jgi:hypothetical protein
MIIQEPNHEGKNTWKETTLDKLRKEKCLCLACDHRDCCGIFKKLYQLCIEHGIVTATTQCRMFDGGEKIPSVLDGEEKEDG